MLNELEWATVAEAARIMDCTPQAVRVRVAQGRLKGERHFGILLVWRADLPAWQLERSDRELEVWRAT